MSRVYEKMTVPIISTHHLTEETFAKFSSGELDNTIYSTEMPGGRMVFVSPTVKDIPEDLRLALEWAHEGGYQWLRFDSDGVKVDESLPVYGAPS